ncbi:LysE family translocator [Glaciimonas immobilis]|uniref:Threonine/homoserine/homoserine lactone efflux protein n=1 Tax=Glaciimonas immobilis TaxID=728004 RepID=A0A840RTD3_9BURK|nr:LysE family translocator [Glaciimonas immobilis]KAF3996980.1 LysE family translocator [Glaciimonas immobilis]MBB5199810.1 threonine/homoserine/homoserine lactone efflux protein [Glaciimonas immobilis]
MVLDAWFLFCISAFFSAISPGPSVVHAIRLSGSRGFKVATASILGNIFTIIVVCVIASIGLSFLKNSLAFNVLRIGGALYLIYVGVKIFLEKSTYEESVAPSQKSYFSFFTEAVFISITNPKIFIFIAAFFPQFLTHGGNRMLQLSIMTMTFVFFTSAILVMYSALSSVLYKRKVVRDYINRCSGITLVLFGLYTLI